MLSLSKRLRFCNRRPLLAPGFAIEVPVCPVEFPSSCVSGACMCSVSSGGCTDEDRRLRRPRDRVETAGPSYTIRFVAGVRAVTRSPSEVLCAGSSSPVVVVRIDVYCVGEERSVLVDSLWGCGMNGWSLAIGVGDVEFSSARSQRRLQGRRREVNVLVVIAPVWEVCLAAYCASATRSCCVCLCSIAVVLFFKDLERRSGCIF